MRVCLPPKTLMGSTCGFRVDAGLTSQGTPSNATYQCAHRSRPQKPAIHISSRLRFGGWFGIENRKGSAPPFANTRTAGRMNPLARLHNQYATRRHN